MKHNLEVYTIGKAMQLVIHLAGLGRSLDVHSYLGILEREYFGLPKEDRDILKIDVYGDLKKLKGRLARTVINKGTNKEISKSIGGLMKKIEGDKA